MQVSPIEPNITHEKGAPSILAASEIDQHFVEVHTDAKAKKEIKRAKFKGPSCLHGEKPDPYLLKLQGPKSSSVLENELNITVDQQLSPVGMDIYKHINAL